MKIRTEFSPHQIAVITARLQDGSVRTSRGCLEWQGTRLHPNSYGVMYVYGRQWLTHRLAWFLAHGDPGEMCVLHRCDNPPCIEPSDLFLGTHAENVADKVAKGRGASGLALPFTRLTPEDVQQIRRMVSDGERTADVADRYGVTANYVAGIYSGRVRVNDQK